MTRLIIPVFVLAASLAACKSSKKNKSAEPLAAIEVQDNTIQPVKDTVKDITVDRTYEWPRETSPFNILETSVKGDMLEISVEYGGGCREHIFKMNSNGAWMKSMPPKMNLWLEHENNGDNCRALIREKLYFDLKPLRYQSSNQVIFIINGEEEKAVSYSYR